MNFFLQETGWGRLKSYSAKKSNHASVVLRILRHHCRNVMFIIFEQYAQSDMLTQLGTTLQVGIFAGMFTS